MPETELVTNCFNFPEDNFDVFNSVKATYGSSPHLVRDTGDPAVDFTLHDIGGTAWNLGNALKAGKPVALIWGMSTCPAYQGLDSQGSSYRWTYWDEYALVRTLIIDSNSYYCLLMSSCLLALWSRTVLGRDQQRRTLLIVVLLPNVLVL